METHYNHKEIEKKCSQKWEVTANNKETTKHK